MLEATTYTRIYRQQQLGKYWCVEEGNQETQLTATPTNGHAYDGNRDDRQTATRSIVTRMWCHALRLLYVLIIRCKDFCCKIIFS